MALKTVKSSNIAKVGYDEATNTLTVHFKSGQKGDFTGVPAKHHTGMMEADSIGSYFHQHIRSNPDYKWQPLKED